MSKQKAKTQQIFFHFHAKIWVYQGKVAWFFVDVPSEISSEIKLISKANFFRKKGWGAVRVLAEISKANWQTSIFPYKNKSDENSIYILPIKAEIRKKANITAGDIVMVKITLV